ncbi:hypothetical protein SpCBS45565_g03662 [Spizellomyces sp. 'palustris']|nr:hypothetical protein SpCBS45565_g03662 [Spizellomyces sp. 'palustris']
MAPPNFNVTNARQKLATLRTGTADPVSVGAEDLPPHYDPAEVLSHGSHLLKTASLGDIERFAVLEQVFVAALDTGNIDIAKTHLATIEKRFPFKSSVRVQRLYGLLKEAEGDFDKAIEIYQAALEQDEINVLTHKRLVAVLSSQGKRTEAIERLVTYVDAFMQDVEAWAELASLYIGESMYQQAAFCFEELLLLRPQNHLYHIRYADLLYTLGKLDLAVKYYCSGLELCNDNLRALYGLRLASSALLGQRSKQRSSGKGSKGAGALASDSKNQDVEPVEEGTLVALQKLSGDRLSALYEKQGKEGATLALVAKGWLQCQE